MQFILEQSSCLYFIQKIGDVAINNTYESLKSSDILCRDWFCYDNQTTEIKLKDFKDFIKRNYPVKLSNTRNNNEDFTLLVVNDIHLQQTYKEGTEINCGQPAGCCEERWGEAKDGKGAGYWGTRNSICDIPTRTFVKTLESIKGR